MIRKADTSLWESRPRPHRAAIRICDFVQGYLLSRPVPLGELRPVLNEINQRKHHSLDALNLLNVAHGIDGLTLRDLFPENPDHYAAASVAQPIR